MDEASLVNSLSQRLSELEDKVHTFRHEMAADFMRYYHELLRDTQPDIASNVAQSLAKSLPKHPDLSSVLNNLDLDLGLDSRTLTQRHLSPPATVATSGSGAAEPPGSPHDRHHDELLFFLPLLEGSPPRQPTSPPLTDNHTHPDMLLPEPSIQVEEKKGAATGNEQKQPTQPGTDQLENAISTLPQSPGRPGHVRRSTNDTVSSSHSDRSESKTPRSALRRSSSGSKPPQSPRRVRFDVMGAEVLPTASPQPTDSMIPAAAPVLSVDQARTDSMFDDDLEDLPPPRKISSSEALRALSREPLEAGVWTEVNSNPDQTTGGESEAPAPDFISSPERQTNQMILAPEPPSSRHVPESVRIERTLGSVSEEPDEDEESSDDDFLSMAKRKPLKGKAPASTSLNRIPEEGHSTEPTASTVSSTEASSSRAGKELRAADDSGEDTEEEDEMFHFEDNDETSASLKPKPKPPMAEEEEEMEVDLPDVPESEQSLYATSPAVHITKRPSESAPTTPTIARFQAGSVGSYKGRPVIMPVVRNPEVHAQAASLGHFNTFVGGLDGRSGMDEADLSSFRASVGNTVFSGTPRSFTERLMMEEAQKARAGSSKLN
ncbi:unnamed protein product [Fusarium graminearum]|uniref:Uncharacterized protein n=1 Tax=Gibberella zeae TaxID=5518 RepID=A0A2H3FXV4_GIBZA|nr:hypothetical protein FG05_06906 [Fusarium graminearum]KAI6766501.1 hypothetical protein HG531_011723 [Fusarium graminearum]PCD19634.1 hypothetical protein FGRA07_05383 [Fusarium graminearum]CAF3440306.1 unnamed protein product [Fusarium graminearum]CAF3465771.1 unnamed protein product [Fusarium graminearum]